MHLIVFLRPLGLRLGGQTYHFKIGIADAGDAYFDAAVFLQSASFRSQELTGINAAALGVKMNIFPTPSSGMLNLNISGLRPGENPRVVLSDLAGRVVFENSLNGKDQSGHFSLDLSSLQSGIYCVTAETEKGKISSLWVRE